MDFNFKLRLIGYYNKPEQNIKPDVKHPEAASELASLLESSFKSLIENANVDDVFRSVLKGNTVFILKNEKGWLDAYCPYRNIARINGVVYNKSDVTPVPLIYKGWFIPGENIPLIFKRRGVSKGRYQVKSVGSDFFVIDDGDAVPLDWGNQRITFAALNTLLNSKYTDLVYFDTNIGCGDCDGYDYSHCDMDRCKNDCEHCGGRRYICDDRCFYHRYDEAVRLDLNDSAISETINPVLNVLKEANAPHCPNSEALYSRIKYDLERIDDEMSLLISYYDVPAYNSLKKAVAFYHKLAEARKKSYNSKTVNIFGISVSPTNIQVIRRGFLFWHSWHIESVGDAYDTSRDQFVRFDFKFSNADERLISKIKSCIADGDRMDTMKLLSKLRVKSKRVNYIKG